MCRSSFAGCVFSVRVDPGFWDPIVTDHGADGLHLANAASPDATPDTGNRVVVSRWCGKDDWCPGFCSSSCHTTGSVSVRRYRLRAQHWTPVF
jgi:hypothetical protein